MNISLNQISESEFKKLNTPVLFDDEPIDRVFGIISDGKNEYRLGWQSESVKPVIKWINKVLCSIGVDLMFVIFDFRTGRILQKLSLDYYFFDTRVSNEAIYVITQLEIIKINAADLVVVETYSLPDYFESIEFIEEMVVVKCVGDEEVKIE